MTTDFIPHDKQIGTIRISDLYFVYNVKYATRGYSANRPMIGQVITLRIPLKRVPSDVSGRKENMIVFLTQVMKFLKKSLPGEQMTVKKYRLVGVECVDTVLRPFKYSTIFSHPTVKPHQNENRIIPA